MSKMDELMAIKKKVADKLAEVEGALRECDDHEDQIANHADAMLGKLNPELDRRAEAIGPAGNDEDAEREYIRLLREKAVATRVAAMAEHNLPANMRGGGADASKQDEMPEVRDGGRKGRD